MCNRRTLIIQRDRLNEVQTEFIQPLHTCSCWRCSEVSIWVFSLLPSHGSWFGGDSWRGAGSRGQENQRRPTLTPPVFLKESRCISSPAGLMETCSSPVRKSVERCCSSRLPRCKSVPVNAKQPALKKNQTAGTSFYIQTPFSLLNVMKTNVIMKLFHWGLCRYTATLTIPLHNAVTGDGENRSKWFCKVEAREKIKWKVCLRVSQSDDAAPYDSLAGAEPGQLPRPDPAESDACPHPSTCPNSLFFFVVMESNCPSWIAWCILPQIDIWLLPRLFPSLPIFKWRK